MDLNYKVIIRKVNELDKNDFLTMADEFYHSSAVDHTISKYHHERTFEELMKSDTYASAYMVELNGKSVGYVLFAKTYSNEAGGMVLWIEELYIREKYRGRGVGKYVLNNILQYPYYYCENVFRIRLEITPSNESAKKLYQSVGFELLDYQQMVKDL